MMSFNELMATSSGYCQTKKMADKWQLIEDIYNNRPLTGENTIPKIIHQIWLGSKIDNSLQLLVNTIKDANPDYEHILWTDESAEKLDFKNKDVFLKCKNYGQKSDILRYAILEKYGGIYLDTDFIGIKSFNDLLKYTFFTGVAYDSEPFLFNGLIGCVPNHPLISDLNNLEDIEDHDGMAVIKTTGPWFLTRKLFKYVKQGNKDSIVMPLAYFYPFPNFDRDKTLGNNFKDYIKDETICVHLWDSRWN